MVCKICVLGGVAYHSSKKAIQFMVYRKLGNAYSTFDVLVLTAIFRVKTQVNSCLCKYQCSRVKTPKSCPVAIPVSYSQVLSFSSNTY